MVQNFSKRIRGAPDSKIESKIDLTNIEEVDQRIVSGDTNCTKAQTFIKRCKITAFKDTFDNNFQKVDELFKPG